MPLSLDSPPRWPLHGITLEAHTGETDNSVAQSQYLSSLRFVDLGLRTCSEHEYRHEHPHEDEREPDQQPYPGMEPTDTAWPVVGVREGGRNQPIRLPGSLLRWRTRSSGETSPTSPGRRPPKMTYTFIAQRCADLPAAACCRAMGVSTSAYYAWQANPVSDRTSPMPTSPTPCSTSTGCPALLWHPPGP